MHRSARWFKPVARAGYASRGVVYLVVGTFALLAAFGPTARKGSEGALDVLLAQPFGRGLVLLMIAGLAGYVLWRLVQSLLDTDDHGWSVQGVAVRGGLLGSAATHGALALYAASLVGLVGAGDAGEASLADRIAGLVGTGPLLFVLCLTFAGVGVAHAAKAVRRRYADHFDASERVMRFVHPISIAGLTARGLLWSVAAFLLARRLWDETPDANEPPGLREALAYLDGLPAGRWLLAGAGVGLLLFAAYSISEAIWRRINVEDAG